MQSNRFPIKEFLNKAFAKVKPDRESFEAFKKYLQLLLDQIDHTQIEEFNKNLVSRFLENTHYSPSYFINVRESSDLVIHHGKTAKSSVAVLFEVKHPNNKAEMLKVDELNVKAFQQLVLYFLRERITGKNLEVKYLVATNIYEWFIFDAKIFEERFAQNKALVKQFMDFEAKKLSGDRTDFFYKNIAKPAIASVIDQIKFTYFDIRDYADKGLKPLVPSGGDNDRELVELYKIFSPQHLLKLDFANDSNSLNKPFYNELLYIIGLTEIKEGGKKLINRKKEGDRDDGSLIENAIHELDSSDKISQLEKPEEFGETHEERLFNVALRLSITWINRVLFLKLLEAQLLKYHDNDQDFAFLNLAKVKSYSDLNRLFFSVLAREQGDRIASVKETFANVPYLNSSLFELTDIEQKTISISNLASENLPIFGATVLIDGNDKKRSGELNGLEYLFEFLHAYKFSKDELEDTQEDSEKLINASVLGLIFEKINGYKDGSFYTPSFITMYMCRETIRRSVVQKFNEVMGWSCENIQDLKEDLGGYIKSDRVIRRNEANGIFNSLKICDPAVGSGHFLVSALNEMIAIKQYLGILQDRKGEVLSQYEIEVVNDKLKVTLDNKLFAYNPKNKESQRVQETLFHEKQSIIEGCLFGVDINPNSVTICRLRLWIELLKNAYYRVDGNLETLPNIDINIKIGNSLISRFGIDVDLKLILFQQKNKSLINDYKSTVKNYFNVKGAKEKNSVRDDIKKHQKSLKDCLQQTHQESKKLENLRKKLAEITQDKLFVIDPQQEAKNIAKLKTEIKKLENVEKEKATQEDEIYSNTFEWRFEFPQVLNDDGNFVGFDAIIGNPPYIRQEEIKDQKPFLQQIYQCYTGVADLFVYFYELGINLLKPNGHLTYISSNKYFRAGYGEKLRQFLADSTTIHNLIDFGDYPVFEEAIAYPSIITLSKSKSEDNQVQALSWDETKKQDIAQFAIVLDQDGLTISQDNLKPNGWQLESSQNFNLLSKLRNAGKPLGEYVNGKFYYGIKTGFNEAFVIDRATRDKLISEHPSSTEVIKPFLRGRDIKKWCVESADLYLLFIPWHFPLHQDSKITGVSEKAEQEFKKNYPSVYNHLLKFKTELSARNQSETGIRYEWYALQRCAASYWREFENPKIVYQEIATYQSFAWDQTGKFMDKTTFMIPNAEICLIAILNSSVVWFFLDKIVSKLQGGSYTMQSIYISQIPIPTATKAEQKAIEKLVQKCLAAKKGDPKANTKELEKVIDRLVYKLYQLTYEEVKIIDSEFALNEQEYMAVKIE